MCVDEGGSQGWTAMSDNGARPVEWFRRVALSVERLAAAGVAGGAVRGATDELRAGLQGELETRVRALLEGVLSLAQRIVEEADGNAPGPLGNWSRSAAGGAASGVVQEVRRLVPYLQTTNEELVARLQVWLDRTAAESTARAQEIRAPGDRARVAAAGAIAGATDQLVVALPLLANPAAELAAQVGRGLVRGTAEETARQLRRAGRSRFVLGAAAGAAALAVLVATRRR
jgi:hypothetical protein